MVKEVNVQPCFLILEMTFLASLPNERKNSVLKILGLLSLLRSNLLCNKVKGILVVFIYKLGNVDVTVMHKIGFNT